MLGSLIFVRSPFVPDKPFSIHMLMGFSLQYCVGLIAASQATTYGGLMAARVIHAFGSGVCEALPVQLVNDIFFLHERGKRLGYYTGPKLHSPTLWPASSGPALGNVC